MIPLRLHLRSCQCLCQLGLIKSTLVAWKEGANGEGGENARAVGRNNSEKEWHGILVGPQGDTNLRLAFRVMAKPGLRSKMHRGWMEKEWAGSTRKTLIKQMKRCKFRKSDA